MEIYIFFHVDSDETMAFSSAEKLLEYHQQLYPSATRLRLRHLWDNRYQVLNHNSSITSWYQTIFKVTLDKELQ